MYVNASGAAPGRTWRFPRIPLVGQVSYLTIIWIAVMILSALVSFEIDRWSTVSGSVWEPIAGTGPWLVGFVSGYVMYVVVPIFLTHGRTRRDSHVEWMLFSGVYSAVAALMVTIGFLLEWVLYRINDWPRSVEADRLYLSHTDIGRIFLAYLLTMLVWSAAGGFVGIAAYRWPKAGWLAIVPASLLIGLSGEVNRIPTAEFGWIADRMFDLDPTSIALSLAVGLPCAAIAISAAWLVLRDVPIKNI